MSENSKTAAARFTAGPWRWQRAETRHTLYADREDGTSRTVLSARTTTTGGKVSPPSLADERLIAAAPALYAALEAWLACTDPTTANVIGGRVADYRAAHTAARAALAQARGEA